MWRKYENSIFEAVKIKLNQLYVLFMHYINPIVNYMYLYSKYAVLHLNFFLKIVQEVQATLNTFSTLKVKKKYILSNEHLNAKHLSLVLYFYNFIILNTFVFYKLIVSFFFKTYILPFPPLNHSCVL